jgi:hypothetical protein
LAGGIEIDLIRLRRYTVTRYTVTLHLSGISVASQWHLRASHAPGGNDQLEHHGNG